MVVGSVSSATLSCKTESFAALHCTAAEKVNACCTPASRAASRCLSPSGVSSQRTEAGWDRACCTPVSRAASRCLSASGIVSWCAQKPAVLHRTALKPGETEPAVHQLAELPRAVCLPAVSHRSALKPGETEPAVQVTGIQWVSCVG